MVARSLTSNNEKFSFERTQIAQAVASAYPPAVQDEVAKLLKSKFNQLGAVSFGVMKDVAVLLPSKIQNNNQAFSQAFQVAANDNHFTVEQRA